MTASRPLHILHVCATAEGAPWLVALAAEQKQAGHEVGVVVPSLDGSLPRALQRVGVTCHAANSNVLGIPGHFGRARAIVDLVRLFRRLRPDVVHGHLLPSVVSARIASWIADVPIRLGANAGPLTIESELLRAVEIGTAFCDTKTIASCAYTRELFIRYGIPPSQTELIHYAVDHTPFDPPRADGDRVRRELGVAADAPLVGMVAYFYAPSDSAAMPPSLGGRGLKGHDVLLEAIPRVLRAFPDAKFALVGRGWGADGERYKENLRKLATKLGIENSVIFAGERTDIPDVLAAFDVSVQPSLNDNLGGSVESLLMARPLIVSKIRGYEETVINEETGLSVATGDPAALADAVIRLLHDRDLATHLGAAGRRHVLERFTIAQTAAKTEALMAQLAERRRKGYRLSTTAKRALEAPLRLLPVVWKTREILRAHARADSRTRVAQVAAAWSDCDWFVNLCRDLVQRNYDVFAVIDSREGNMASRLAEEGIRTYRIPMTFGAYLDRTRLSAYIVGLPLAILRLARILRREGTDIVHSHIFTSNVIARFASALARARHVAGIPGPRHLEAALTRTVDRLTLWLDDATLAGCRYTCGLYAKMGVDQRRLASVYYGPDADRFNPAVADAAAARRHFGVAADAPLISLVAHFYAPSRGLQAPRHTAGRGVKGHDDFIAAARIIACSRPAARFLLAGSAKAVPGEEYRRKLVDECAADPLLRDRVIFAGHVDDVPSLLAASNVVVQPSLTENLGGTIEALLMERPVVATRVGGLPESVRDGETGLLVPHSDPESLARAVLRLLDNPEEAVAFGRAGRRLMLDRFTSAHTAAQVAAVYASLPEKPRRSWKREGAEA